MKKRLLSILIFFLLLFNISSGTSAAIWTEDQFKTNLMLLGKYVNKNGRTANYSTYRDFWYNNQIVYGLPFAKTYNDYKQSKVTGRMEYRYLGYSYDDIEVTNTRFPNDPGSGGTLAAWSYIPVSGAPESWGILDMSQTSHILSSTLTYPGDPGSKTINSLGGQSFTKILSSPTWKSGFSVYTRHKAPNGDGVRYATLFGPPMGSPSLTCTISTPYNTYTIKSNQKHIDIPVTVTAAANLSGSYVKPDQISYICASFEGSNSPAHAGQATASITVDKRMSRSNFAAGKTNTVTFSGQAVLRSKYNDSYNSTASKTITLIVEEEPTDAGVSAYASANPGTFKYNGSDVNVDVTVNAVISKISSSADVDHWVLTAKKLQDGNLKQATVLSGLTAQKSFSFTISKSDVIGDSYTQMFITTASVFLKDGRTLSDTAGCSTYIYKEDTAKPEPEQPVPPQPSPPQPSPLQPPPTGNHDTSAIINAPFSARAGETVVDPTPAARIKYSGSLKENRKITLDSSASFSPESFPLDNTLTTWAITPISGGTPGDIKYSGALTGFITKDVLFKKAGQYKVTLTVTNTAGFSNTATVLFAVNPDVLPVADFDTANTVLRNYEDYNRATIKFTDLSYTTDNDTIVHRTWKYAYDSDNNGDFNSESWVVFDDANNTDVQFKTSLVGRYLVELSVKEAFGQDTIGSLISDSDYKTGNTAVKAVSEKIVEVRNIAPVVDFALSRKRKADIFINIGNTAQSDINNIATIMNNNVIPSISAENIDVKYSTNTTLSRSVSFPESTQQSRSQTITIPGLSSVTGVSVNTGNVSYSLNGNNITMNVSNGGYTSYSTPAMFATSSQTSSINSFPATVPYYNGSYSGTLSRNGSPYSILLGGSYVPPDSKTVISAQTSSINSFPASISYDGGGYGGSLYKNGNSYIISGSYIPDGSKTATSAWYNTVTNYGHDKPFTVTSTTDSSPAPSSVSYNYDGYSGILYRTPVTDLISDTGFVYGPLNPRTGQRPFTRRRVFRANYSGTATKPAVDTRVWQQDYSGIVTKPAVDTRVWGYRQDYAGTVYGSTVYYYSYNVIIQYKESMANIIKKPSWRTDAEHYYIDINDMTLPEMTNQSELSDVLSDFIRNNTRFIGMGTDTNKLQLESLISKNDNKGLYMDNSNINAAFNSLAAFIINDMSGQSNIITRYVILNDDVEYNTFYSDAENDPLYSSRWKYTHDPGYFDNSLGQISNSGVYLTDPIIKFDRVGKFDVVYQARDNPLSDSRFDNYKLWSDDALTGMVLYVHRKPVARFSASLSGIDGSGNYVINISESSYDLDHTSRTDKGIAAKVWLWKEVDAVSWNSGPPSALAPGKTYLLQLKVQDLEGAWSDPAVQILITSGVNFPPTVDANPVIRDWGNTDAACTVTASDPSGDYSYTGYIWSGSPVRPGLPWNYSSSSSFNTTQSNNGVWYLHMEAWDAAGNSFYRVRGPYSVDKIPPVIDSNPQVSSDGSSVTANISSSDSGGSGLKSVLYCWTDSAVFPPGGWTSVNVSPGVDSYNFSVTHNNDGAWFLHMQAVDNAGNTCYRYKGPYTITGVEAYDFTVTMILDINWRGYYFDLDNPINGDGETYGYPRKSNTDIKTARMPVNNSSNPVPYLYDGVNLCDGIKAGCKVKGYIRIKGDPDYACMSANYPQNSVVKTETISLLHTGGDKYTFEWIVPPETDNDSYISFNVIIRKGSAAYGNTNWKDTWPPGNNGRIVFHVRGSVIDDIVFTQSN